MISRAQAHFQLSLRAGQSAKQGFSAAFRLKGGGGGQRTFCFGLPPLKKPGRQNGWYKQGRGTKKKTQESPTRDFEKQKKKEITDSYVFVCHKSKRLLPSERRSEDRPGKKRFENKKGEGKTSGLMPIKLSSSFGCIRFVLSAD